jgi:NAD(P)-dependent dehydrogenase (short-subunit alcohol dehydrogenase family)
VGHFVLFKLLVPLLQSAAKNEVSGSTRVVWVASIGHVWAPKNFINFDDPNLPRATEWVKYGQSKAVLSFFLFSKF